MTYMLIAVFILLFPQGIAGVSWLDLFQATRSDMSETETILMYGIDKGNAKLILFLGVALAIILFVIKASRNAKNNPEDTALWYRKDLEKKDQIFNPLEHTLKKYEDTKNKDKDNNDRNGKTDN